MQYCEIFKLMLQFPTLVPFPAAVLIPFSKKQWEIVQQFLNYGKIQRASLFSAICVGQLICILSVGCSIADVFNFQSYFILQCCVVIPLPCMQNILFAAVLWRYGWMLLLQSSRISLQFSKSARITFEVLSVSRFYLISNT